MVSRSLCKRKAPGSIPGRSTIFAIILLLNQHPPQEAEVATSPMDQMRILQALSCLELHTRLGNPHSTPLTSRNFNIIDKILIKKKNFVAESGFDPPTFRL